MNDEAWTVIGFILCALLICQAVLFGPVDGECAATDYITRSCN